MSIRKSVTIKFFGIFLLSALGCARLLHFPLLSTGDGWEMERGPR